MLRAAQVDLLRWTVAASGLNTSVVGRPDVPRALIDGDRNVLWASGLSAYIRALTEYRNRTGDTLLPPATDELLMAEYKEVGARSSLFRHHLAQVVYSLDALGVPCTMVKGFTLSDDVWPRADVRPMADVDLVVRPADMRRAADALDGMRLIRLGANAHELVYELWPDTSDGRHIGESRYHAGKVEIHPSFGQRAHGYSLTLASLAARTQRAEFEGVPCQTLDAVGRAMHTLGHLSAAVIRREVRPLNVLDTLFSLGALRSSADDAAFAAECGRCDPRLTAPGLWLAAAFVDTLSVRRSAAREVRRLTALKRRLLAGATPATVIRDPAGPYPMWWRLAWATSPREGGAVVGEVLTRRFRPRSRARLSAAAAARSVPEKATV